MTWFACRDAQVDACRVAEDILMGVDAIRQLRVAVVGLDGPDREVTLMEMSRPPTTNAANALAASVVEPE
jgi:hypothetical protein